MVNERDPRPGESGQEYEARLAALEAAEGNVPVEAEAEAAPVGETGEQFEARLAATAEAPAEAEAAEDAALDEAEDEAEAADDAAAVVDGSLADVLPAIAAVETIEELDAVEAAEVAGRNRVGALDAIAVRRAELEGAE